MALKDEFDQFRIHRLTCAGKPERYAEVSRLTSIFVQRRLLELEHGRELGRLASQPRGRSMG